MIVLDTTIVNVALPSIQRDLHFTQGNLTWVVNAFLITFGSFLLLAGRLGDLFGRKRVFLAGVARVHGRFGALRPGPRARAVLIAARFLQGVGGSAVGLGDPRDHRDRVPEADERARAMSAYVFVAVAGGSLGLLAGGALTQALSWHWIFFVNLPIGVATFAARAGTDPRATAGIGAGGRRRLARLGARHRLADDRRLRDRAGDQPRLGLAPGARLRGARASR